jgi:lysophospholipase L1-like esterase
VVYVDVAKAMQGDDGRPRPEPFAADGRHLSAKDYAAWAAALGPRLK